MEQLRRLRESKVFYFPLTVSAFKCEGVSINYFKFCLHWLAFFVCYALRVRAFYYSGYFFWEADLVFFNYFVVLDFGDGCVRSYDRDFVYLVFLHLSVFKFHYIFFPDFFAGDVHCEGDFVAVSLSYAEYSEDFECAAGCDVVYYYAVFDVLDF